MLTIILDFQILLYKNSFENQIKFMHKAGERVIKKTQKP
tara:strand:+ start:5318 stop:5434 length:117 start_codon:yes stop_codon:yes gene_type:complete